MDQGTIPIGGFAFPPFPILCAAAVVLLSWVVAIVAPTQFHKLQTVLQRLIPRSNVFEIAELRVYPIKSCRGFSLSKTNMHMHGLSLDRQWMLVDGKTHRFVSMRELPRMTLINTNVSEDGQNLLVSMADEDEISIPTRPSSSWLRANTTLEQVRVWSDDTDGYMYGPEVNEVFTRFLGRDVRLVYKGPKDRILRKNGAPHVLGRVQSTFFADGFPLLIASTPSIAELNSRLSSKKEERITIERFRPNIIVRGNRPWAEDSWKIVRIYSSPSSWIASPFYSSPPPPLDEKNSIIIDVVSRCTRCTVPNVEPATAKAHKKEPSSTLSSYRRIDPGAPYQACFGMNGAPQNEGLIEVGMRFEVLEETDQHRILKD
jgi:uncharacterized protein